jgi:hypothetical protein
MAESGLSILTHRPLSLIPNDLPGARLMLRRGSIRPIRSTNLNPRTQQ